MFDEAHNPRSYNIVNPEGTYGDIVRTKAGDPAKIAWNSTGEIGSAVSALMNPSMENISQGLGRMHKVRNFYNNIADPWSPMGDSTIDTHAIAAQYLRPLTGKDPEVLHNFGSGIKGQGGPKNSSITGMQGTYGINTEPYARAAADQGILPREMQSITWEAIRGLFDKKTPKIRQAAEGVWNQYKKGRITQSEAQESILELAGGVNAPAWTK